MTSKIGKTLTPNDIGVTGSHQAGIAVSKDPAVLEFFPFLDKLSTESIPDEINTYIRNEIRTVDSHHSDAK